MSTFVTVGNAKRPFPRLLDTVSDFLDCLPRPVTVQYGHSSFRCRGDECEAVAFLDMMRFETLIKNAEVLILHAGAGSVIHALRAGKTPIVMPRLARYGEHVNNHQLEFASALASEGRVIMVQTKKEFQAALAQINNREVGKINNTTNRMISLIAIELELYACSIDKSSFMKG